MIRPRPYLSWSQLTLFESSLERYMDIYIDESRMSINRGMAFGKEIADALEKEEATGDPIKDLLISQIPKFEIIEAELEATLKLGKTEIPLYGKADTAKKNLTAFKEYKTGQTSWSQKQVDNHGQITLYCTIIRARTGKIPKDIELVYIPTKRLPDDKVELTGDIHRIKTSRTLKDILKMEVRIKKAWEGIGQMCEEELL